MKSFERNRIEMLSYPLLESYDNIFHFVTTRRGGVSQGKYGTLNLGLFAGDEPERVQENRRLLCDVLSLPSGHLLLPRQVHGAEIAVIGKNFRYLPEEERLRLLDGVDALLTDQTGYCIGVATADCVPLLFYDPEKRVIGAAHAGWRGTVACIGLHCIRKMEKEYGCKAGDIRVTIGPSISRDNFEVGPEVVRAFRSAGFPEEETTVRHPETGKFHIDLREANRHTLLGAGIRDSHIEVSAACTYEQHTRFFSARREGFYSGRFISAILLKP